MIKLLTTIDGVDKYDCDTVYVIRSPIQYGAPEELKLLDNVFDLYKNKGYYFFSNKENADRFMQSIIKNKLMLEFQNPIPVIVEGNKEGYAIYATHGGIYENDLWTVALCDGGIVRTYRIDQLKIHHNATFDILKTKNNQQ